MCMRTQKGVVTDCSEHMDKCVSDYWVLTVSLHTATSATSAPVLRYGHTSLSTYMHSSIMSLCELEPHNGMDINQSIVHEIHV